MSVPVTILCGFLGAGKTTLLNHVLGGAHGKKLAVIVNEFGEVGIDGSLVRATTETMVELSNGCICCTLRGDLIEAIDEILRSSEVDGIIIESTGIGEPLPIAQTLYVEPEVLQLDGTLPIVTGRVFVDAIATVVDAVNFFPLYNRKGALPEDDRQRGFGQLLAEQIEGANIVVINKVDKVSEEELRRLEEFVAILNPYAEIVFSEYGDVEPDDLIGRRLFSLEQARGTSAWMYELAGGHASESEEYGISTFVYSSPERFDEQALIDVLSQGLSDTVLRSKGYIALWGTDTAFLWNQAGALLSFEPIGEWSSSEAAKNEIVFIGSGFSADDLRRRLDGALHRGEVRVS